MTAKAASAKISNVKGGSVSQGNSIENLSRWGKAARESATARLQIPHWPPWVKGCKMPFMNGRYYGGTLKLPIAITKICRVRLCDDRNTDRLTAGPGHTLLDIPLHQRLIMIVDASSCSMLFPTYCSGDLVNGVQLELA